MTDHAIIAGSFSDFKLIKTRSTAQLIIEIPIEQADEALERLGGVPQSGKEKPVAVARLDPNVARVPSQPSEKPAGGGNGKTHRLTKGGRLAREAGIACNDRRFRRFMEERYGAGLEPDGVAERVRDICGVDSRVEFDSDPTAAERWNAIYAEYLAETR